MRAVAFACAALTLAGCSGRFDGRTYESVHAEGRELVEGTPIVLEFEQRRLEVRAGCNIVTSGYDVDDGTLRSSGEGTTTAAACPGAVDEQEFWVVRWLSDGVTFDATDATLTLEGDGVTIEFERR
jgi:heat shock protein HslJ